MARKRWQPGSVIRKRLGDGWNYYARLMEFPWAAFYDHRTKQPEDDLDAITPRPVRFTIAVHKDLLAEKEWEPIGRRPLDGSLQRPRAQVIWGIDPQHPRIMDDHGAIRPATPKECEGLEPAAVWEPEHVADRLMDAFAGRPNRWLQAMLPHRD
jgi:hypothetical protein